MFVKPNFDFDKKIESSGLRWRYNPQIRLPLRDTSGQVTQITLINKVEDKKTYSIIGAAMEVHKELGCGFLEAVYEEALAIEFKMQGLPYEQQKLIEIMYKKKPMEKKYQPDFVCFGEIIVEIKALTGLSGNEEAQVINYLKATQLTIGLLINFGTKSLEYKRLIYST